MRKRITLGLRVCFVILMLIILAFSGYNFIKSNNQPKTAEVVNTLVPARKDVRKEEKQPINDEKSKLADILKVRREKASQSIEYRDGKQVLYADETYGGKDTLNTNEQPVGTLSIPKLNNFSREIVRGIGASPNGNFGEGDFDRLYHSCTWRYDQVLGGDNYVVVSHIWTGRGIGVDYSNEWFSPLLTSKEGGMTTDLSKLVLQKGDEITVKEYETGITFKFEIDEIKTVTKNSGQELSSDLQSILSSRVDHPRITLQGCLQDKPELLFVVGKLISIEQNGVSYKY